MQFSYYYNIIQAITSFQFFFLAIFLFTNKKGNRVSNNLFALFLFGKGIMLAVDFFSTQKYNSDIINYVLVTGNSFLFFYTPFLYLYTKSFLKPRFRFSKRNLYHFIPFVFSLLLLSANFFISKNSSGEYVLISQLGWIILILAYYIQAVVYTIAAIKTSLNYRENIKRMFSNIEQIKISWLTFILSGFLTIWFIFLGNFMLNVFGLSNHFLDDLTLSIGLLLLFGFVNAMVFKCLKEPAILIDDYIWGNGKTQQLPKAVNEETAAKLTEFMKMDKPFLSPSISLSELADKLSIHPKTLSLVIKHSFNKNFYDYVNGYRIEEAKNLLSCSENQNKTLLEILMDVGFNSKSVFNTAFKKHTGMTPSEYKKIQISN